MPLIRNIFFSAIIISMAAFLPAQKCFSDGDTTADAILEQRPWLADASSFVQQLDLTGGKTSPTSRGGFGLGTGYVFAIIGVGWPHNTLTNIVGPNYEKSEDVKFYQVSSFLNTDAAGAPEPYPIKTSRLYRVKKTSINVLEETGGGLTARWINFAPFGGQTIFRIITLTNDTGTETAPLSLEVEIKDKEGAAAPAGNRELEQVFPGKRMVAGFLHFGDFGEDSFSSEAGSIKVNVGAIPPGETRTLYFHLTIYDTAAGVAPDLPKSADELLSLLDTNREEWLAWMEGALTAESSDGRLGDLFDNTLVLLKTQTPGKTGGIAVMARYSGMWCRDTFGPIRFFLPAGKYEEVKGIARFYDLATRLIGFRNRYPVDLDLDAAPAVVDWDSMAPQQGDDPNLLILQYYHYFKNTGDADFIRGHYGFLRRNLLGQEHTDYRLPFHGDETYQVYVMMAESATMHDFYSADTGFEFTVAAAALSEMAETIGEKDDAALFSRMSNECRKKTEEYYWNEEAGYYIPYARKDNLQPADSPFADIDLHPVWLGYADPGDPRQKRNIITTAKKLMNKGGTMKTTARVAYYTGMLPGFLLYNLKAIGAMKQADMAWSGMMDRVISPTGEFAEAYDGKDRWMNYAHEPNIYRPWETSINVEAVLYYVTGLKYNHIGKVVELAPYLPPGVDHLKMENLHAGPFLFSLDIARASENRINIEITNTGSLPVKIDLRTEPATGEEPPEAAGTFQSDAYGRTLWRETRELAPGERFSAHGGVPAK